MNKLDIKSMSKEELKEYFMKNAGKSYHASQVYEWLHKKLAEDFRDMTNLSKELRNRLSEECDITHFAVADERKSLTDGTCKYLFELQDHNVIECVLMRYRHGNSVCISSQVGCKMGCRFCASTIGGLTRNLTTSEMLESVYMIQRLIGERVSNIVIMGTGEPLDNYDNVVKFIKMVSDSDGINISQRNITVSTCGIPDKMREFAEEGFAVTLALSLHAPNDELRRELMPVANLYELPEVLKAFDYYYEKTGRRLTFEYSLIRGVNDGDVHADALVKLVKGKNAHINLIPVNPVTERDFERSDRENILKFKKILEKNRINVTIRREMGTDIDAACGQLRKSFIDNQEEGGGVSS